MQQQQPKPMFAGELAARAGTFKSGGAKIYLRLVWFAATTLAFTPERLPDCSPAEPFGRARQTDTRLPGSFVGCKLEYLFGR